MEIAYTFYNENNQKVYLGIDGDDWYFITVDDNDKVIDAVKYENVCITTT